MQSRFALAMLGLAACASGPAQQPRMEESPSASGKTREQRCAAGEAAACHELGELHENGSGRAKDLDRALELYERSCDLGHAMGCWDAGFFYGGVGHPGLKRNNVRACDFLERACAKDDWMCGMFGRCFVPDNGGRPVDQPRACGLFERACDAGHARECIGVGLCHWYGHKGYERKLTKACVNFEKACTTEEGDGCFWLARALEVRVGGDPGIDERVLGLVIRSCDAKQAGGCQTLAYMYEHGLAGLGQNAELVRKYNELACSLGRRDACSAEEAGEK